MPYNKNKYNSEWTKNNLKCISFRYSPILVDEFKEACKYLNVSQSEQIRKIMMQTIEEAKKQGFK